MDNLNDASAQSPTHHVVARYAYSVLLLLVVFLPPAFIINTTSRRSPLRILWIPVFVFSCMQHLAYLQTLTDNAIVKTVVTGCLITVMAQCLNHLVITGHDAQSLQGIIHQATDSPFTKLTSTSWFFFNLRGWKTPWQVRNIPPFPRFYNLGPHDAGPSKGWFVLRELLIISWQYLFIEVLDALNRETPPEEKARSFGPGTEYAFRSATPEQLAARIVITLASMPPARIYIDVLYRTLGLVLVVPGFLDPGDWPPLFGSLWESYTLRGFWSNHWHQLCRSPLTSASNFITRDLLHLRRPSRWERYLNVGLALLFSGIGHLIEGAYSGVPPSQSGTLLFFPSFAMGIMIEDAAQQLLRLFNGGGEGGYQKKKDKEDIKSRRVPLWRKIIGFVWVFSWFCVVTPILLYPNLRREARKSKGLHPVVVDRIGMASAQAILGIGGMVLLFGFKGEI